MPTGTMANGKPQNALNWHLCKIREGEREFTKYYPVNLPDMNQIGKHKTTKTDPVQRGENESINISYPVNLPDI